MTDLRNLIGSSDWVKPVRKIKLNESSLALKANQGKTEKKRTPKSSNNEAKTMKERVQPSAAIKDAADEECVESRQEPDTPVDPNYTEIDGDLFECSQPFSIIINCISADVKMGAGIALSFASRYPEDVAHLRKQPI